MFFPCKPLLLGSGNDLTVPYKACGGVMVEGRYAEDVSSQNCLLKCYLIAR